VGGGTVTVHQLNTVTGLKAEDMMCQVYYDVLHLTVWDSGTDPANWFDSLG